MAANAQKFSELYSGSVKDVFVPKVYSELTTSKVLTMEWVDGFRLTDSKNLDLCGLDKKSSLTPLSNAHFDKYWRMDFFMPILMVETCWHAKMEGYAIWISGLAIQVDPQARIISEAYPYI